MKRFGLISIKLKRLLEAVKGLTSGAGDFESTLKKIVSEAISYVKCDRCSVFLLDEGKKELWTKDFKTGHLIIVPANRGIIGYTVNNKVVVNIKDAYEDDRFNREVDKKTGYRTKSILSIPIFNDNNSILGVIQCINKEKGQ